MEYEELKFLCSYHAKLHRRFINFTRKSRKFISLKDTFYDYVLNSWGVEDEALKCYLAMEIHRWIEDFDKENAYIRDLLTGVLEILANCGLDEDMLAEAWASYIIRCNITDKSGCEDFVIKLLAQRIETKSNRVLSVISKKMRASKGLTLSTTIFKRLVELVKENRHSYLAFVDGTYWNELGEIIQNSNKPVSQLLSDRISQIQQSDIKDEYILHQKAMEYARSILSDLHVNSFSEAASHCNKIEKNDKFGICLFEYIEARVYSSKVLMLLPSWLKFSKSQIEIRECFSGETAASAPGSHLYWFCCFVLGVRSLLKKHNNLSTANALFEVVHLGVLGGSSRGSYAIKYINSNMPPDTEATLMLKNDVRKLLEDKMLLDAVIEYTYYLSCLHEPYGISQKRRSWFKKNIQFIFLNYDGFLYTLRRMFLGILQKERTDYKILLESFDIQREQLLKSSKVSPVVNDIELNASPSEDDAEEPRNSHEWQCFVNKVWIQTDLVTPDKLIELKEHDAVDHLGKYLSKWEINSMIEPKYILNSLCNYMRFKEQNLHHRNPVWIDDIQWTKIRKGKVRLLVRSIRDDLVFHAYKRKDYHSGMFD